MLGSLADTLGSMTLGADGTPVHIVIEKGSSLFLLLLALPMLGAILCGVYRALGVRNKIPAWTSVALLGASFVIAVQAYMAVASSGHTLHVTGFDWINISWLSQRTGETMSLTANFSLWIDSLTALWMLFVTGLATLIALYASEYMEHDVASGHYSRFFSAFCLFVFAMTCLVMGDNMLLLFLGWEGVGLCSYLLIGFWYKRESAIFASLKAFLVNRVGDFGFVLGIAAVLMYFHTLDYSQVFGLAPTMAERTVSLWSGHEWSLMSVICICLFIGAMGKSAQFPLHVWLPDSMEGPTPISALIHAATMVTAGIFMVARMSPLYELSETALNLILIIGAITAFFMGLLGLVQNDIKRVIAYSTLSQLGYMAVALGASAYSAAIFHLVTHAFFKALMFLAAGSVIIVLHHEQDMRKMGGLYRYMPVTWLTCLIGSLALIGFPGTSGFFSKDSIIEAVHASHLAAAGMAYYSVLFGVFITGLYTFRMFFLTFHGKERIDYETWTHLHEAPAVVTVPLTVLAIPSLIIGAFLIRPMLFQGYFGDAIRVAETHDVLAEMGRDYHGLLGFTWYALQQPVLYLALAGVLTAWLFYIRFPALPDRIVNRIKPVYLILMNKYGFDDFNQVVFAGGTRRIGDLLWRAGDVRLIDGLMVNGTALAVRWFSAAIRQIQSGYLYHYAFVMIIGLLLMLSAFAHKLI